MTNISSRLASSSCKSRLTANLTLIIPEANAWLGWFAFGQLLGAQGISLEKLTDTTLVTTLAMRYYRPRLGSSELAGTAEPQSFPYIHVQVLLAACPAQHLKPI